MGSRARALVRRTAPVAAALFALAPAVALADVELFSVDYEAEPGCPPEDTFVRELTGRTAQARPAPRDTAKHHIRVRASQSGARAVGQIEMREGAGPPTTRSVDGRTCREVVSGLALIAALALDPEASLSPVDETPRAKPPPPTAPPPIVVPPRVPPKPPPSLPRTPWVAGAGLTGGGTLGILPTVLAVGSAFVELEKLNKASIRLAFEYGIPSVVRANARSARLDFLAGRIEGCPFELRVVSDMFLGPCLGIDAGRIAGTGLKGGGVERTRSGQWPWLAVAAGAHLRLDWGRFVPRIDGGVLVPLFHEAFVFEDPNVELSRVAPVVGFVQAGLGVRFP